MSSQRKKRWLSILSTLVLLLLGGVVWALISTVTTLPATSVTATSAALQGSANPNGEATTVWFRMDTANPGACDDVFGTRVPGSGGTSLGAGSSSVPFSAPVASLLPGTTYYFCAIAQNASGTALGAVLSFTTPALAPTVTTVAATAIANDAGTLNGTAVPNGSPTTGFFRYSTTNPGSCNNTFGTRAPNAGGASLGSGGGAVPFSQALSGLLPGTTYYYCALALNGIGTSFGPVLSFTTLVAAPTVTTLAATVTGGTTATLNGTAAGNGAPSVAWFRYATSHPGTCNDSFGTRGPVSGGTSVGSGTTAMAYSLAVGGLAPGTTYYYCAISSNAVDTSFGEVLTFTTFAVPTMTTDPATNLTATSVTLNGTGTPNGATTTAWFRYATTNPGACSDTFGTRLPSSGGSALGAGGAGVPYVQATATLSPGTTYYYCAIASNSVGLGYGSVTSFTTPSTAPIVSTGAASAITGTTATLNGSANPRGDATSAYFRWGMTNPGTCTDAFGTRVPVAGGTAVGAGNAGVPFSEPLVGLSQGTTYYYCAAATNSVGTTFGAVASFVTADVPAVTTAAATSITSTSATLNGTGNPKGAAATGYFRYSTTNPGACDDAFGTRAPGSGGSSLGGASSVVAFAQGASGLSPGTTYYYCAIATNAVGTGFGAVMSFTTLAVPTVTTAAVTSLTPTSVTFNGSASPNGAATTAWFRYSTTNPGVCSDAFGTRLPTTGGTALGAGTATVPFAQSTGVLLPGTTYYYCAIASNSVGFGYGAIVGFTTPATAPIVSTGSATAVTSVSGTLNGSANPRGDATVGYFRWGTSNPGVCSDAFGTRAPVSGGTALGAGNVGVAFAEPLAGLSPGTTYYYCAAATNSVGTSFGSIGSFVTADVPVVTTTAATSVTSTTATLNGTGNPKGAAATGYFRYSATDPGACDDTFGTRAPAGGGSSLGAGASAVAFAQGATGLSPGTTYYYCAIATSSVGSGFGNVMTFTTLAAPTVTTSPVTNLTATSVTLNGAADPNGAAATAWFRYSTTDPGTCSDTFGTRLPAASGTGLGNGTAAVPYAQSTAALQPGTTYYYCAIASNSVGLGFGTVTTFSTPATAPIVFTGSASAIAGTTATLNGTGTPRGDATSGYFRWGTTNPGVCSDAFGTRVPGAGGTALGSGNAGVGYTEPLTGLTPGTTYFYCAAATNSIGTTFGSVVTFVTADVPVVSTAAATAITSTSATLNGTGNPRGAATTGYYRFSPTDPGACDDVFGTRLPASGGTSLGSGAGAVPFGLGASGLSPGTTYFYCAIATNSVGTGFGSVMTFTTLAIPTVATAPATNLTATSATLNGTADPNGAATTAWLRYATTNPGTCTDTFGTRLPVSGGTAVGAGTSAVPFAQSTAALQPGTTYYYCAIASNSVGVGYGTVMSFSAPSTAPIVSTGSASVITGVSATLNGTANPRGDATDGYFRWGTTNPGNCSDAFGTRAPASGGTVVGSGNASVAYSEPIAGLTPGTTYYFCAAATNSIGTTFGGVTSFVTAAAPTVTTVAVTGLSGTGVTLNGTANPRGGATTGWFRYATSNPGACDDTFGTRAPASGGSSLGSSNAAISYAQGAAGLSPGTTYYYCAIAQNSVGTGFGAVLSFTTLATPTVVTAPVTNLQPTSTTLNATANPNGATSTGWFRYSTGNPGTCTDAFGTRIPVSGGTALGAGASAVAYAQALGGLSPGTTYYYCAMASNSVGVGFGAVTSFVAPATAPIVTTGSASVVTDTGATLNGSAIPRGDASSGYFRYGTTNPGTCTDAFGVRVPVAGGTPLGAGNAGVPYTETLTGLTAGTTYYYCAAATNSVGTTFGTVTSFTTASAPVVTTGTATNVSGTNATLNGTANPNRSATVAWFRYDTVDPGACSDSFGVRAPASGGSSVGSGSSVVAVAQTVTGLSPGTTYYFCAIAQNTVGTALGSVVSFKTLASPTVTTSAVTSLAATSATLNGQANPNSSASTGWFRYAATDPGICSDTFGTRLPTTGGTSLGAGAVAVPFAQAASGLLPGTTYYYCAIATNSISIGFGSVMSFTTPATAPVVTTVSASLVTGGSAQLNGTANPRGDATEAYFRYGTTNPGTCSDAFGIRVPGTGGTAVGSGAAAVSFSSPVSGLSLATTYYYCAAATNSLGTTFGAVFSFTTVATPPSVTTMPATSVGGTSAILNGSASPNGAAATGWFRYGTTDPGSCNDAFGVRAPAVGGTALGSGTTAALYSVNPTNFTAGVTYYYCAIASNSVGTSFGAVQSFTTPTAAAVTTGAATSVTATSAALGGTGTPNGAAATGYFRYGTSNPGTCSDAFGARAPASGGSALGSGSSAVAYTQPLQGLTPATTYYYCAAVTTSLGTAFGSVLSFVTAAAPTVLTGGVTDQTSTSITLNGAADPNGDFTIGYFRYDTTDPGACDDTFGTAVPAVGGAALGAGNGSVSFSEAVSGLTPGSTYYYCAVATNSFGTAFGAVFSFSLTGSAPSVTTSSASGVTGSSATLNGSANPNGLNTTGWFRYSTSNPGSCDDTFGVRTPAFGGAALGAGTSSVGWSTTLTGLTSGATYYVCAIASNGAGLGFGDVVTFSLGAQAPTVTTQAPTGVSGSSATFRGVVTANAPSASGWFRYDTTAPASCNDTFGARVPVADVAIGNQPSTQYSATVSGLDPSRIYYYCAIASNSGGAAFGNVVSFTTQVVPPAVLTLGASVVAGVVDLDGLVNPNGASTTAWFQYDTFDPGFCTSSFGQSVPLAGIPAGSGRALAPVGVSLPGLAAGRYYYCAAAFNSAGTSFGDVGFFDVAVATGGDAGAGDAGRDAGGGGDAATGAGGTGGATGAGGQSGGGTSGSGGDAGSSGGQSGGGTSGAGGLGGQGGLGGAPEGGADASDGSLDSGNAGGQTSDAGDASGGDASDAGPASGGGGGASGGTTGGSGAAGGAPGGFGGTPTTGGSSGSSGTAGGGTGGVAVADAGVPDAGGPFGASAGDTGGCGCRVTRATSPAAPWLLVAALAGLVLRRRGARVAR